MAKVEFQFNGVNSVIQFNEEQNIYEIFNTFMWYVLWLFKFNKN